MRAWELKVHVNDKGELLILSEQELMLSNGETKKSRKLIKKYILPKNALTKEMSSKLGEDGRLVVNVPLASGSFDTL